MPQRSTGGGGEGRGEDGKREGGGEGMVRERERGGVGRREGEEDGRESVRACVMSGRGDVIEGMSELCLPRTHVWRLEDPCHHLCEMDPESLKVDIHRLRLAWVDLHHNSQHKKTTTDNINKNNTTRTRQSAIMTCGHMHNVTD